MHVKCPQHKKGERSVANPRGPAVRRHAPFVALAVSITSDGILLMTRASNPIMAYSAALEAVKREEVGESRSGVCGWSWSLPSPGHSGPDDPNGSMDQPMVGVTLKFWLRKRWPSDIWSIIC